jgi:hypothetical protein
MRTAKTVVAPHGMGLAHLAFHTGRAKVIELHNPNEGTDTYAFLTKGKGFEYTAVLGTAMAGTSNFRIAPREVHKAVDGCRLQIAGTPKRWHLVMTPSSDNWFSGCQSSPAVVCSEVAARSEGVVVLKHMRDPGGQVHDTNVGWWRLERLQPLRTYSLSCLVYLPADFNGTHVKLCIEPREAQVDADLSQRDQWQLLSITLTMPREMPAQNLVLRVGSTFKTTIYSSDWRVDELTGASPTAALSA